MASHKPVLSVMPTLSMTRSECRVMKAQGRNMNGRTPYDMFIKGLLKKHKLGAGKSAANAA